MGDESCCLNRSFDRSSLVKSGIAGQYSGKVRALLNEKDKKIKQGGPSQPVQVLGFDGLPQAGDKFVVMADEQSVREISTRRQTIYKFC